MHGDLLLLLLLWNGAIHVWCTNACGWGCHCYCHCYCVHGGVETPSMLSEKLLASVPVGGDGGDGGSGGWWVHAIVRCIFSSRKKYERRMYRGERCGWNGSAPLPWPPRFPIRINLALNRSALRWWSGWFELRCRLPTSLRRLHRCRCAYIKRRIKLAHTFRLFHLPVCQNAPPNAQVRPAVRTVIGHEIMRRKYVKVSHSHFARTRVKCRKRMKTYVVYSG